MKRFDDIRRALSDDSGMAMAFVVGVLALMTVIAVAAFAVSQQSLHEAARVQGETQAFQAANAAVDMALARMQSHGYASTDYPVAGTDSVGSSYEASVTTLSNSEYLCVANGTDKAGHTETIKVKFFYLNLWNMNLANGSDDSLGGGTVRGTTSVYGPFYVRGSVELGSNSTVEGGPFFIRNGDLNLTGSGTIGSVTPGGIDLYVTGALMGKTSNAYTRTISHGVPDISLPTVDAAYMLGKWGIAKSESIDNRQGYMDVGDANLEAESFVPTTYRTMDPPNTGGVATRNYAPGASQCYKVVGSDTSIAALGQGASGLTIGGTGSWGAQSYDGLSTHDDFAFNDATNLLTVEGTVFIDGPLVLAEDITYRGNGTIVCNGPITIAGSWKPNGTSNNYMDATHCVGLVTPGNINVTYGTNNNKEPTANPDLCGAFFASKDFGMSGNGVLVKGSVLAGGITFSHANQHLVTDPNLSSFLPRSLPGSGNCILTKGAWVR